MLWLFAREMLKLQRSREHGGATGLTKERKCWERSVRKKGLGVCSYVFEEEAGETLKRCFSPDLDLYYSFLCKLIAKGLSVMPTASGCSFCPKFSDDVQTVSAEAPSPSSRRSFRKTSVFEEFGHGNEAELLHSPQPCPSSLPAPRQPRRPLVLSHGGAGDEPRGERGNQETRPR